MQFERRLYKTLEKQINTKEIIVLTGMRRVGKTTLLRMIYNKIRSENKVFFDIENPLVQKIFEERDYNNIWANLAEFGIKKDKKCYIFLDEIQSYPDIVKVIKYLFDHYEVKFFVTGSSSYYLKNLFPESLAGRKIEFVLSPLDFEEFLIFKKAKRDFKTSFEEMDKSKNMAEYEHIIKYYYEYLTYGGFPQIVLNENIEQKNYLLQDIFKSYFEKDVNSLGDIKLMHIFRDLILLLLTRIGSKLDITKLSSELGIKRDTVYSYLSFLHGTYFIDLVPMLSQSLDREISGSKKVYICDNGFANNIAKVSEGALLENAVYLNLKKFGEIKYFQKRTGKEIDFIIPSLHSALEVKRNATVEDYRNLNKLAEPLNIENKYVISYNFNKDNGFIPALYL